MYEYICANYQKNEEAILCINYYLFTFVFLFGFAQKIKNIDFRAKIAPKGFHFRILVNLSYILLQMHKNLLNLPQKRFYSNKTNYLSSLQILPHVIPTMVKTHLKYYMETTFQHQSRQKQSTFHDIKRSPAYSKLSSTNRLFQRQVQYYTI